MQLKMLSDIKRALLCGIFLIVSFLQLTAQIDSTLIGTWSGNVELQDMGNYTVEMTIRKFVPHGPSGEIEYDNGFQPCTGKTQFLGTLGNFHYFSEFILNGFCVDSGRIRVHLLSNDTLQWNWDKPGVISSGPVGQLARQITLNTGSTDNASEFEFSGIYPNPLINEAQFSLQVSVPDNVVISLTDLSGKEVSAIYNGMIAPHQEYVFTINRNTISGGLYILQIKGADSSIAEKVIIVNQN